MWKVLWYNFILKSDESWKTLVECFYLRPSSVRDLIMVDNYMGDFYILNERKIEQRLPCVGGNVKSYMLTYDFSITAYTR